MAETLKTFLRYLLFQILGWAILALVLYVLVHKTEVPRWAAMGLFILWVIKDLAMFPLVRSSYEGNARTGAETLIGSRGRVQEPLTPEGYVKINGELWKAQTESPDQLLARDTPVRVRGARGFTLIVEVDKNNKQKPKPI
jgi:membrane protein implicated in regulation of membrane protease activity